MTRPTSDPIPDRVPKGFVPMPFAYRQEVEVQIHTLTNLGTGLGRVDNWVVMIPGAIPGDRVLARVYKNHKNFSLADLVRVLEPSPDRIAPRCPLFGECGGCQYQNMEYARQLEWKRLQISELMERMADVHVPVNAVVGSPVLWGYRSKITPHFGQAPTAGKPLQLGFKMNESMRVVDVPRCPIATDAINETYAALRARIEGGDMGRWKRGHTLLLRHTLEGVVTDNNAIVSEKVGDLVLRFRAGEFFQNNPFILPSMVAYALDKARASGATHFVDAYCGVGLFALAAAPHFEQVSGVEVNEQAVALAITNARENGIANVEFLAGKAEAIFDGLAFDGANTAVLMDPPRKGSDEAFIRQLVAFGPRRVVYVSCEPSTQARDLRMLAAQGYRVTEVQPFDLFPHTRHIENVAVLDRMD